MPAIASRTVRKRRLSSAERRVRGADVRSPITSANYGIAVSPSGGFAATSPLHGEEFLKGQPLRRLRRHLPITWGGVPKGQPLRRLRRHLPITWGGVPHQWAKNEAAPAADTASTGMPPGDTRLVF